MSNKGLCLIFGFASKFNEMEFFSASVTKESKPWHRPTCWGNVGHACISYVTDVLCVYKCDMRIKTNERSSNFLFLFFFFFLFFFKIKSKKGVISCESTGTAAANGHKDKMGVFWEFANKESVPKSQISLLH